MNGWLALTLVFLGFISVALIYTDLRFHQLPNALTFGSYPVISGLLLLAALTTDGGLSNLARAAVSAVATMALYALMHAVNQTGLGLGDVKLAPVMGAVLGWHSFGAVLTGTIYGFVLAGVVAALLLLTKRVTKKDEIAFGPFMILGMWLALIQTA